MFRKSQVLAKTNKWIERNGVEFCETKTSNQTNGDADPKSINNEGQAPGVSKGAKVSSEIEQENVQDPNGPRHQFVIFQLIVLQEGQEQEEHIRRNHGGPPKAVADEGERQRKYRFNKCLGELPIYPGSNEKEGVVSSARNNRHKRNKKRDTLER